MIAPTPGATTSAAPASTLAVVRQAVRQVLHDTPELRRDPALERRVAQRMVEVSMTAAELLAEEKRLTEQVARRAEGDTAALARAQAAGDIHRRTAVNSAAGVLRGTKDAIDFPGFVTSLITGVFQSIQTSNIQQLQAFADLLDAVGGSSSDFAATQITDGRAAQWAVSRWSGVFAIELEGEEPRLILRDEADLPDYEELARVLEATDDEVSTIDEDELNETLLPLVRRKLARDRQSMLATMVLMGMQRVVVDDGSLHASMRLQVDARSTAEQTEAEQFDTRVDTEASGSFGAGAWGASAKMSASVGYVKSDEQYTREDIGVSAGLRSSVDLRFRTLPLDVSRMADDRTLEGIRDRSMVPEAEREIAAGSLIANNPDRITSAPDMPTPAAPGSLIANDRGTMEQAVAARREAAQREERRRQEQQQRESATQGSSSSEQPSSEQPAESASQPEPEPTQASEPASDTSSAPAAQEPGAEATPDGPGAEGGGQTGGAQGRSRPVFGGMWGVPHSITHSPRPGVPR